MSVIYGILLFSLLIFVHELGHFVAAKLSGVQVNEFSLFMGPALWKKQVGQTLYAIRLIPLGGYCAMEGEDGDSDNPHAFHRAAWWKKLVILVAGAAMNFLMGIVMMLLFVFPAQRAAVPVIESFEPFATLNSQGGLREGDEILEVDGEKIYVFADFSLLLSLNPGDTHDLVVNRGGEKVILEDFPMEKHVVTDENGNSQELYGMNFSARELSVWDRVELAWNQSVDTVRMVRLSLQMLFSGQAGLKDMTGPVGIVQQISQVAAESPNAMATWMNLMYFGGFIAINLAVMNLLPIPALDGGRVAGLLITLVVETITGKKLDPKYEGWIHGVGMMLLLGLMAVLMFKDVIFLFR